MNSLWLYYRLGRMLGRSHIRAWREACVAVRSAPMRRVLMAEYIRTNAPAIQKNIEANNDLLRKIREQADRS